MTRTTDAPRTARALARAELTRQIVATAREHLAVDGAPGLSLRAVARDLGMASSAVYRYVPSRDDLLTLLIIESYDSMGAAAEAAEAQVGRADLGGRFRTTCRAVRAWALERPHEYALLFGSPVPGYAAPQDTVGPAVRVPALLIALLVQGHAEGRLSADTAVPVRRKAHAALRPVREVVPAHAVPDEFLIRGLMSWTQLFGTISMELFGHLHNVVGEEPGDREAYFEAVLDRLAAQLGLPG